VRDWPSIHGFGYGTSGVASTIGERRALPHELAVDVRAERLGQLPRGEHGVEHAEVVEHLEVRGCRPSPREPVNGVVACSTIRTAMPRRARSTASVRPVGPVPEMNVIH
jgi:hypothetical protein